MTQYERFLRKLGQRIREERVKAGLTQEDMESHDEMKIEVRHYQRIEAGEVSVALRTLYKIAKRLRVPPGTLLDF